MSLSTLLEAAKYLDYLDSNNRQQQQQQQHSQQHQQQQQHPQLHQPQPIQKKANGRRQRASRKNPTTMATSLPVSTGPLQAHGLPIPMITSSGGSQQTTSLSSSLTTGSPLSSFASTALLCSKASGITSASSSAASSLSSSDSSSSCGEILMGDNDSIQTVSSTNNTTTNGNNNQRSFYISNTANHHDYHITHQNNTDFNQRAGSTSKRAKNRFGSSDNGPNQSVARYIAATTSGPHLVTMTTNSTASSAPTDVNARANHIINAANDISLGTADLGYDSRTFSKVNKLHKNNSACHEAQAFTMASTPFVSDSHLSNSPGSSSSCTPFIMARIQPMILNSLSPSTQSIMAFQPATASSPTSSSSSYSRHRELHKTLEKNRRAHLRHCFELLKAELPASECADKKTSHINIIKSAIRYVLALRQQECEIDNELQRLTKIKSELTETLSRARPNQQPLDQLQQQQQRGSSDLMTSDQTQIKQEQKLHQPAAPEQQLSFLLSQSKID